ncbi:MAG: AgmX/PglI C-terminal domain-containing protein [Deltaproteobacteria bacterium]|nr:MAG: AgmX/PglI C-terminal domain-containing protein [Deltaproteobacteria bacterium]
MTRASTLVLIAGLAVGCGGGKQADTTPTGGGAEAEPVRGGGGGGGMVAPEKMDEVERSLDRKAVMISRCLSVAVDNKELPKNAQGKVTLEIVISPAGRAESVKIVRAQLDSKSLHDCIIRRVQEIQFPELPRKYETSHTYGFEAM